MVKTCPKCKAQVPAASQFCTCGYLFSGRSQGAAPSATNSGDPFKVCPQCQTQAPITAAVCATCRHAFRTQFGPPLNQTQVFNAPLQPATRRVSMLVPFVLIPCLCLGAAAAWAAFAFRSPSPDIQVRWRPKFGVNAPAIADVVNVSGRTLTGVQVGTLALQEDVRNGFSEGFYSEPFWHMLTPHTNKVDMGKNETITVMFTGVRSLPHHGIVARDQEGELIVRQVAPSN